MNNKIKAVIFDAGGVITEWRSHMEKFALDLGSNVEAMYRAIEPIELDACKGLIEPDDYCQQVMNRWGFSQEWQKLRKVFPRAFTPIKETYELLVELKGKYRLAMLTNAVKYSVDELDKKLKHKQFFEVIVDSSVVGMVKPDKEIYFLTCQRLGFEPSQCLFVDDQIENIDAAKKIGFKIVHFTDPKNGVKLIREILYGKI